MLVFWKHSLVYLATPKTGTTAIHAALDPHADAVFRNPPGLKHSHLYRFETFVRPLLDRVEPRAWETVAVMREPASWIASWYRYRQRDELSGHRNSTRDIPYARFIEEYLSDAPPPRSNVGSQHFFMDLKGEVGITHLFAYEALHLLTEFFEERLGVPVRLKRQNGSPPAQTPLPLELEDRLRAHLERDYAIHDALRTAGGRLMLGPAEAGAEEE
ncbi:hypothetical protein BV394_00640 [Brevirhabdus pacifica]|uniref:Uncharacterized protein n=1 Tax=Brevirhabdus pacifica TaxID=1267768 RepID=A0A1U7DEU5_9RHOB|nr:hypothetical protein [Brevirhabdus pacifica]APX88419.1 hypothetical protein BV394_00640 [Brevirhabdus pacifica]PJJ87117.1 hypothetical protein CLV77_1683 [Brevirhabdus pacifica]